MTQQEIYASLDAMLLNPKSKNFLNHLVRAYLPSNSVTKVSEKPKGNFKCAITTDELISIGEILLTVENNESKEPILLYLNGLFNEDSQIINPVTSLGEQIMGGKKIGVTGKETTTYMSYETYKEFYTWVQKKSLSGDKHINWLLSSLKLKLTNKKKEHKKPTTDVKIKPTKSSFTLGDASDALSKLKAQLESKK